MKAASVLLDSDLLIDAVINLFEGREPEEAEVTAACSALSYAAVREDQKGNTEKATELRKLLSDRGIVVQSVLNGYTMHLFDTKLSPAGDLCAVQSMFSGLNKSTSYCIMASRTLRPLTMIDCPKGEYVECVCFAPDSRRLALLTKGSVKIWDLPSLRVVYSSQMRHRTDGSCSWSSDSRRLAVFAKRTVHLFDVGEYAAEEVLCKNISEPMGRICLNGDGSRILTADGHAYSLMDSNGRTLASDVEVEGGMITDVFWKDGFRILTRSCLHTVDEDGRHAGTVCLDRQVSGNHLGSIEESEEFLEEYQRIVGREEDGRFAVYIPEGSGYCRNTVDKDLDVSMEYVAEAPGKQSSAGLPAEVRERILDGNPYTTEHSGTRLCMRTSGGFVCAENVYSGRGCSRTECSRVNVPAHSDRYAGYFLKPEAAEEMFARRTGGTTEVRECESDILDCAVFVNSGSRFDSYLMHEDTDEERSPWEVYEVIDIDALADSSEWALLEDSGMYAVQTDVCGMPAVVTFDGSLGITMLESGFAHLHSGPEGIFFHDSERVYRFDDKDGCLKPVFGFRALPDSVKDGKRPVSRIIGYDGGYAVMCGVTAFRQRVVFMDGDDAVHNLSTDAPDAFCVLDGRAYWVNNRMLHVLDLSGFRRIADMDLRVDRQWKVAGISSDGTVSFVRFSDMKSKRGLYEAAMEFGMMRCPDYRFETFGGVRQRIVGLNPGFHSVSVCRNDAVYIDGEKGGASRLFYGHLGRDGMSNMHSLTPDIGRADAKVFPVSDGRYLMVAAGNVHDENDRRMLMRLMDAAEGVPISYGLKGTKGQMYGESGYRIDQHCRMFVSDDCTHLMAESVSDGEFHINSWDITTGKRYPEDGSMCGRRLLDYTGGELRTAVEDASGAGEAEVCDKVLDVLRTERLDVAMGSDYDLKYIQAEGSRVPLNGYAYEGESPGYLCLPANIGGEFRDMVYESVPVIIPIGEPVPVSEPDHPRPACYGLYPDEPSYVRQRCLLAQLKCGRIMQEQETELVLAVDGSLEPSDAVCGSISDNVFLYVRNGGYMLGQLMSHEGQIFDPEFTCTLTDRTDSSTIERIVCRDRNGCKRPVVFSAGDMYWISDEDDGMVFRGSDGTEVPLGLKDPDTNPEPVLKTGDKVLVRTGPHKLLMSDGRTSLPIDAEYCEHVKMAEDQVPGSIILECRHSSYSNIRILVEEDLSGYRISRFLYAPVTTEFDIGSWIVRNRNGIYTAEKKGF